MSWSMAPGPGPTMLLGTLAQHADPAALQSPSRLLVLRGVLGPAVAEEGAAACLRAQTEGVRERDSFSTSKQ